MAGNRIPGLSPVDEAAIDAIVAGNRATNQALAELAHAIAARDGVTLDEPAPQSDRPSQKNRRYRLANVTRGVGGEMTGDLEYSDGRVRRFHMSRDGNGELAGEIEDVSAADAGPGPATEIVPEGNFADVFGSLEGT